MRFQIPLVMFQIFFGLVREKNRNKKYKMMEYDITERLQEFERKINLKKRGENE